MRIGIVGGVDRSLPRLDVLAHSFGHELEHHTGHLTPRGRTSLESLITRADMLLVITDVNSHSAVRLARQLARKKDTPVRLMRRLGPDQLSEMLRAPSNDVAATTRAPRAL